MTWHARVIATTLSWFTNFFSTRMAVPLLNHISLLGVPFRQVLLRVDRNFRSLAQVRGKLLAAETAARAREDAGGSAAKTLPRTFRYRSGCVFTFPRRHQVSIYAAFIHKQMCCDGRSQMTYNYLALSVCRNSAVRVLKKIDENRYFPSSTTTLKLSCWIKNENAGHVQKTKTGY